MQNEDFNANELDRAENELYTYIDWLYNTGRITTEERDNLNSYITECVIKDTAFGYYGAKV